MTTKDKQKDRFQQENGLFLGIKEIRDILSITEQRVSVTLKGAKI